MKKTLTALATAAMASATIVATTLAPASAAQVNGSVQIKYSVGASATLSIGTNYAATGATGSGAAGTAPTINQSPAAGGGSCGTPVAETTAATLQFGTITPPSAGSVGCLYKNAIVIGLLSNDSVNGVKILEGVDSTATGVHMCAVFTDTTLKATPTVSAAVANPAAYTASCQVGTPLSISGSTASGAAPGAAGDPTSVGGPASNVNATPLNYLTAGVNGGNTICTCTGSSGSAYKFLGQDVQMNVDGTATVSAVAQTFTITISAIPQ